MESTVKKLRPLWVHDSISARVMSLKRCESLFSGVMDQRFHYMTQRQSQLWMDVHRRHAPLFEDSEFISIFQRVASDLALDLAGRSVHVVGVGSGGGEKEAHVLSALHASGCRVTYTPLDVSMELAIQSAEAGARHVCETIHPVVGDLSALEELGAWPRSEGQKRVFTFFGLAPNIGPSTLSGFLSRALGPDDELLLSANLSPVDASHVSPDSQRRACAQILPQYDNDETRLWLKQVLVDWGISQYLGEPCFEVHEIDSVWGIVADCRWLSDVRFAWEGKIFEALKGKRLRLFFSLRYTVDGLRRMLGESGLSLGKGSVTPCKQEGVWRVRRSDEG